MVMQHQTKSQPTQWIRLLLIDDDVELGQLMSEFFAQRNCQLEVVTHGSRGLESCLQKEYDAILLDVMLPGIDGFTLLRQLRLRVQSPVIMLTARSAEQDRIMGLNSGADDYLIKPFAPEELLARIRAILRRMGRSMGSVEEIIQVGPLSLATLERKAQWDGISLPLTDTEYIILEHLARTVGRIVPRRELMAVVYQCELVPYDRSLDVHLSHVRKKLGIHGTCIRTIRGEGYQLLIRGSTP